MGLTLAPGQIIHQTKAYALQNKEMHVNKPLSINLAIIPEKIFGMTFFQFFPAKRGHFFVVLLASKSHLINYS